MFTQTVYLLGPLAPLPLLGLQRQMGLCSGSLINQCSAFWLVVPGSDNSLTDWQTGRVARARFQSGTTYLRGLSPYLPYRDIFEGTSITPAYPSKGIRTVSRLN